jgi:membrane protein
LAAVEHIAERGRGQIENIWDRGSRRLGIGRDVLVVLWKAAVAWTDDGAMTAGAAIAFYTIFSLGPGMLIILAISGAVFGEKAATGAIYDQITSLIGSDGAAAVQGVIKSAADIHGSWFARIVGPVTVFISATAIFSQIQATLNVIWKAPSHAFSVVDLLRIRLWSFLIIIAAGFIFVVSLVVNAGIAAFGDYVFSGATAEVVWLTQTPLSVAVIAGIFALTYKVLPDAVTTWGDVAIGALTASILFNLGKFIIGFYLAQTHVASSYGAAGTFILILLWVYYSSLIFLYGAEVSRVWHEERHGGIAKRPAEPALASRVVPQAHQRRKGAVST